MQQPKRKIADCYIVIDYQSKLTKGEICVLGQVDLRMAPENNQYNVDAAEKATAVN